MPSKKKKADLATPKTNKPADEEPYVDRALVMGWRIGDVQIKITGGRAVDAAKRIFELYSNVLEVSTRVDSGFNLVARVYYSNTQELQEFMEILKRLPYVRDVRFSEISAIIRRRAFIEKDHTSKRESAKLVINEIRDAQAP